MGKLMQFTQKTGKSHTGCSYKWEYSADAFFSNIPISIVISNLKANS